MTKPVVHYRDPQSATKLRVDALLALPVLPAFATDVDTGTELPIAEAPVGRLVVVRSGVWTDYSVGTAVNRCRVVVYGQFEDDMWDLAFWLHGRLLALPGDQDVVSYQYDDGPTRAKDPDLAVPIVAFAVRARMRVAKFAPAPIAGEYGSGGYLVLGAGDPVPEGTPANTVIIRTE